MKKYSKIYVHSNIKTALMLEFEKGSQTIDDSLTFNNEVKKWKATSFTAQSIRIKALELQKELLNNNKRFLTKYKEAN